MRKLMSLLTLLVIAMLGWGGYWFFGATATERALSEWLAERRAEGWTANVASLETRGFPNRFDTSFEGLELADPETATGWSAPLFQLLSLSYRPNHVIAVWPGTQRVILPEQEITVTSAAMLGSIEVAPESRLPLIAATVETQEARLSSSRGWETAFASGQLSIRQSPAPIGAHSYDLYFDATEVVPPAAFVARLADAVDLPETIATLRLNGRVAFEKGWDRSALERARPQPRKIRLDEARAQWGGLALDATGELDVNVAGEASGTLELRATNWRAILATLEASGKIDPAQLSALEKGLGLLAGLKGNPETLDVPLGFSRGVLSIGPVPVMPAPTFTLP